MRTRGLRGASTLVALAGVLALTTACGGPGGGGGGGGLALGGPHWDMKDACKAISVADVEAATGHKVESTEKESSAPADGVELANCRFVLSDRGKLRIDLRANAQPFTDADIQDFRTFHGSATTPAEVVPGLGNAAFYMEDLRMLQVVPDRKHWASVIYGSIIDLPTSPKPPGAEAKAKAIAVARKLL